MISKRTLYSSLTDDFKNRANHSRVQLKNMIEISDELIGEIIVEYHSAQSLDKASNGVRVLRVQILTDKMINTLTLYSTLRKILLRQKDKEIVKLHFLLNPDLSKELEFFNWTE